MKPFLTIALILLLTPISYAADRPNVLLILADDLGAHDLGCFGSTYYETPNINRLASLGVRLTSAYSASPLCSPTRSSIMVGQHPARTGITSPACHLPTVVLTKQLVSSNARVKVANSLTRLSSTSTTLFSLHPKANPTTGDSDHAANFHNRHHLAVRTPVRTAVRTAGC